LITPEDVIKILKEISVMNDNSLTKMNEDSLILNDDNNLDSMAIVQLCIALEDKSKSFGFDFDWTSEKAMSSMNSIFKTPRSISNEFNKQLINNKKS
tara:strand:+ start:377 stop:667 length:291 start_codon:yes stop_codon:yes gene_type:complete